MDPITFRRWRDLTYHDPAEKLQEYVATLRGGWVVRML